MQNLKYNSEETKQFQQTLSTIIDDMDTLWNLGALDEIKIPVYLPEISKCYKNNESNYWNFIMDESGYYLSYKNDQISYTFARRNQFGKLKKLLTINEQDICFIKAYPSIRENFIAKIEEAKATKNENLDFAKKLSEKLTQTATIEIDLPESINQHQLEVVEEDGRKIGTLNFGNISLRIITSGNVELVNKPKEEVKTKRR